MTTTENRSTEQTVSKPHGNRENRRRRSLLADAAYHESDFPAIRLVRSTRWARRTALALGLLMGLAVSGMLLLPWQQTVTGSGSVVAYAPLERQQVVNSPLKGRIARWGENIQENSRVRAGQLILEIQDLDPLLVERYERQVAASERQLTAAQSQLEAAWDQLKASRTIVESTQSQLDAWVTVREQIVAAADEYVRMAESKIDAVEEKLNAAEATLTQASADYRRQAGLFEKGIASELKMQVAEQKLAESDAKVRELKAEISAANSELEAKRRERSAKEREYQAKVDSADATLRKAQGDVAKTESDRAKAEGEVTKAEKELLDAQVKLARQRDSQLIRAPRDGYIMNLLAYQGGEFVKEGDPLFTLVPSTESRAVQIWVDGRDAPLIEPGRHVRLQFEGWPAVQFSGWPSVAVGTFGGRVDLVDASDDGKGRFRVLVVPDHTDATWPRGQYLRQGVRANGWVLLDRVPLWYEMWRQINGFPPTVSDAAEKSDPKKDLPKIKTK